MESWRGYFHILRKDPSSRWALLEFVADGSADQYLADADALHQLISEANPPGMPR